MDKQYDVEEILKEIRDKRRHEQQVHSEEPAAPVATQDREEPASSAPSQELPDDREEDAGPVPAQETPATNRRRKKFVVHIPDDELPAAPAQEEQQEPLSAAANPTDSQTRTFAPPQAAQEPQEGQQSAPEGESAPLEEASEEPAPSKYSDYESYEDTPEIQKDLKGTRRMLLVRLFVTGVALVLTSYLLLAQSFGLPLPEALSPQEHLFTFVLAGAGITIVAALFCPTVVGGGLLSLLTMKADGDSLTGVTVLACIGQGIFLAFYPPALESNYVWLYYPVAALLLFCNTIGKLIMIKRIDRNFKLVSSSYEKNAVLELEDRELVLQMTKGFQSGNDRICYAVPTDFLSNFLDESYSDDYNDRMTRIMAPLSVLFALIAAGACYFFTQNWAVAVTGFTAILCFSTPATAVLVGNIPLNRMAAKLSKWGAMISGYDAVERFSGIEVAAVRASDLFPGESVVLHGIKVFEESRIDEAILDAASVVLSRESTLTNIFMNIIGQNTKMLKKVTGMVYEDGMGVSAWIDGKRVLIGNRTLMENHEVDIPSHDYENKFIQGDRQILYLANSGRLTAMFVLSYRPDEAVAQQLEKLLYRGIGLSVYTNDPNVTAGMISSLYDYPKDLVYIISSRAQHELQPYLEKRPRARGGVAYTGSGISYFQAITAAHMVRSSITVGTILQIIGMFVGFGAATFFSLTGAFVSIPSWVALCYQLFWLVAIAIVPNIHNK